MMKKTNTKLEMKMKMKMENEDEYEDDDWDDDYGDDAYDADDDTGKPFKANLSECHKLQASWLNISRKTRGAVCDQNRTCPTSCFWSCTDDAGWRQMTPDDARWGQMRPDKARWG